MRSSILLSALLTLSPLSHAANARDTIQLGGASGLAWEEMGALSFADVERVPGSIRPFETEPTHNLISTMRSRGGDISTIVDTYTIPQHWLDGEYEWIVDGDSTTAFVHPARIKILGGGGGYWTVPMFFDLGAPFLVERIRFMTRPDHPENQMRRYILYLNDGSVDAQDRVGNLIWTQYRQEIDNLESIVDLDITPQRVRHIYILPGTTGSGGGLSETWEVAEMQVFGRGYVPAASFVSTTIDLGAPSTLGQMHVGSHQDEGGQVIVQTRSGSDDQPYVYWRVTGVGDELSPDDLQGRPLTKSSYENLKPNQRGGITDDLANWSPWQTHDLVAARTSTQILSPSPRRYLQIRLQFFSDALAGGQVDSLRFEYSQPPVVAAAVGEISPAEVPAASPSDFTYAVRSRIESGQSGFDAIRLRTEALLDSVRAVRIDGVPVSYQTDADSIGTLVRFPRITQDQSLLELDFGATVFRYGTPFDGDLIDTESDEVPLPIIAGDAVAATLSDELVVRTTLGGAILPDLRVEPNPFTPNGDGINDEVVLSSAILRLTGQTPLRLQVFSLGGRLIRDIRRTAQGSAELRLAWDGRDDAGNPAPPGAYVYRLTVETDAGSQTQIGQLAVVY